MKISKHGDWTIYQYKYKRSPTLAADFAIKFVIANGHLYPASEIDNLLIDIRRNNGDHVKRRIKDTLYAQKHVAAKIAGTDKIDHFQISISEKTGRLIALISQPIGAALNYTE